jgi:hypothetical protein
MAITKITSADTYGNAFNKFNDNLDEIPVSISYNNSTGIITITKEDGSTFATTNPVNGEGISDFQIVGNDLRITTNSGVNRNVEITRLFKDGFHKLAADKSITSSNITTNSVDYTIPLAILYYGNTSYGLSPATYTLENATELGIVGAKRSFYYIVADTSTNAYALLAPTDTNPIPTFDPNDQFLVAIFEVPSEDAGSEALPFLIYSQFPKNVAKWGGSGLIRDENGNVKFGGTVYEDIKLRGDNNVATSPKFWVDNFAETYITSTDYTWIQSDTVIDLETVDLQANVTRFDVSASERARFTNSDLFEVLAAETNIESELITINANADALTLKGLDVGVESLTNIVFRMDNASEEIFFTTDARISDVTDPTNAQDVATKNYVDSQTSSFTHTFETITSTSSLGIPVSERVYLLDPTSGTFTFTLGNGTDAQKIYLKNIEPPSGSANDVTIDTSASPVDTSNSNIILSPQDKLTLIYVQSEGGWFTL